MAHVQIITRFDVIREKTQLANRTATFPLQACLGQAGFLSADFGDGIPGGINLICDLAQ